MLLLNSTSIAIANAGSADLLNNGGAASPYTKAYTCGSGSNRFLVVGFLGDVIGGNDDITSVTYAGTAMTLIVKNTAGVASNNRISYVYGLVAPASGANNVVISYTNTHYILACAADYSGVSQSTPTDGTGVNNVASNSNVTASFTTTRASDWGVIYLNSTAGTAYTYTITGGYVQRVFGAAFKDNLIFDSGATISTGAQSVTMTASGSSGAPVGMTTAAFGLAHA